MDKAIHHLSTVLCNFNWKYYACSAVAYLLIALVIFYPLTLNIKTMTPGSGATSYQNLWGIWWVNYAIFNLHTSIYHTGLLFWPIGVNLIYQVLSPLLALISAPFQAFGVVFAYNSIFFLSFVLSGLGMLPLAKYVTKNSYAAFFAGLVFTFSSFHIAQAYAHISFLNIMFVPLFLYFIIKTVREGTRTNVIGMAASFALSALIGGDDQTLMLALLLVAAVAAYVAFSKNRKHVLSLHFASNITLFIAASFIMGSWLFVPLAAALVRGTVSLPNPTNSTQYSVLRSSDLLSFVVPSYYNGIFGFLTKSTYLTIYAGIPAERTAYLTFTALLLSAYFVYKQKRQAAPWVAGAVVSFLLSLGPYFELGGAVYKIPDLYSLYRIVPFINLIGEPGRFNLLTTVFLAILASLGLAMLLEKAHTDKKRLWHNKLLLVGIISFLFVLESNGLPLNSIVAAQVATSISVPHLYEVLATVPGNFSILQLPASGASYNSTLSVSEATYYASVSHKPLVGGYASRTNDTDIMSLYYIPLVQQDQNLMKYGNLSYENLVVENSINQTLLTLLNYNTEFVVLDKNAYNKTDFSKMANYLFNVFGNPVYSDNYTLAFSTAKATNNSMFRSFVSYPILSQWSTMLVPFNGTYRQMWVPYQSGAVVVYAPYANASVIHNATESQKYYPVNTTITIRAIASSPQIMYVSEQFGRTTKTIALLNLTSRMQSYEVPVTLEAGSVGNSLFFMPTKQGTVAIMNITFSRGIK